MGAACWQVWFVPQSFGTAPKQTILSTEDGNGRLGLQIVASVDPLTGALDVSACMDGACTVIPDILEVGRCAAATGGHNRHPTLLPTALPPPHHLWQAWRLLGFCRIRGGWRAHPFRCLSQAIPGHSFS